MEIALKAEKIGEILGMPVTNTLLMSWIAMGVIIGLFLLGTRVMKTVPSGLQNLLEALYEGVLSFMDLVTGNREHSARFFPLVFTFFIFILTSNWLGILPGLGSIGFYEVHEGEETFIPYARSANSDLNMTLALAFISVVATHAYGMKSLGIGAHISKFFSFKGPIDFFVGILEFVSEFAKILSFSFRLFGNIFAGEVLLIIVGILLPFVAPIPFLGLELFVGLIQALIFATLTLVFLEIAVAKHH